MQGPTPVRAVPCFYSRRRRSSEQAVHPPAANHAPPARRLPAEEMWVKQKPMQDEEMMLQQVEMTKAASPTTKVFV